MRYFQIQPSYKNKSVSCWFVAAAITLYAVISLSALPVLADETGAEATAAKEFRYGYVGVKITKDGRVLEVFANTPADRAHILKGDIIVSIDGQPAPKEINALQKAFMGMEDTPAILVIERAGQRYRCEVSRKLPATQSKTVIYPPPRSSSTVSSSSSAGSSSSRSQSSGVTAVADSIDKEIVSILRRTPDTDDAYNQVIEALHIVSQGLKQRMADQGFKVVITPLIIDAFPDKTTERPSGYTHGGNYLNCPAFCRGNTIYVAERVQTGSAVPQPNMGMVATFMHEFGHAYDHLYKVSDSSGFQKAFEADCQSLTNTVREQFYYYLQPGDAGPAEMFAEQTSYLLSPGHHRRKSSERVAKQFPKCAEFVRAKFSAE